MVLYRWVFLQFSELCRANLICGYLFTGNTWKKYTKRNGMGATWWVKSRRTRQTGFCGFDQAITGAIYFTFNNGKKYSFDRPNYTSIQVFHFNISLKKKPRKEVRFDKQNFFRNFNPILRFARCEKTCLTGPLEYKYYLIQIFLQVFWRYLYCTKCSWMIHKKNCLNVTK